MICMICGTATKRTKTCSSACLSVHRSRIQAGELSVHWKSDGNVSKAQSHLRARKICTDRVCAECGLEALDVHHIDGNPFNNDPSNLAPLCRKCHLIVHGRIHDFVQGNKERGRMRAEATHCRMGHEFSPENTYVSPRGARRCKTCHASWRLGHKRMATNAA